MDFCDQDPAFEYFELSALEEIDALQRLTFGDHDVARRVGNLGSREEDGEVHFLKTKEVSESLARFRPTDVEESVTGKPGPNRGLACRSLPSQS